VRSSLDVEQFLGELQRLLAGPTGLLSEQMNQTVIKEPVASVAFIWVDAKGAEHPVKGVIGRPYQLGDDQWACAYLLEGAFEQGPDIAGVDSIQALSLALYGLYHDLIGLLDNGGRLLHPSTRQPFDLVTLKATFSRSTSQFRIVE
jgi:hypothetical protein